MATKKVAQDRESMVRSLQNCRGALQFSEGACISKFGRTNQSIPITSETLVGPLGISQDLIPDDDEDEQPEIEQEEVQDEMMTRQEQEEQGFYDVQEVLKHKYMQGWKFLTHWEGFPISAATWEPSKSFKLTHGRVNSKFREYCEKNNLLEILRRTLQ